MLFRAPLIVLAAALSTPACELFNTREAESPGQTSSRFLPPTEPSIVLENLASAMSERNIDNYIRSFVDSSFSNRTFEFIPTQDAQSQYFTVFSNWSLDSEREYFENLRSQTPPLAISTLIFSDDLFQSLQSDSAVYNASYRLIFPHNRADTPTDVRGNVLLFLSTDSRNNWVIHQWVDFKTGSDFSWSELKGRFSN